MSAPGPSCCETHKGPHVHGCTLPAPKNGRDHAGACLRPVKSAAVLTDAERDGLIADVERAHIAVNEAQRQLRAVVDEAKRRGLSWSDIGAGTGQTKQAASYTFKSRRVDYADQELPLPVE